MHRVPALMAASVLLVIASACNKEETHAGASPAAAEKPAAAAAPAADEAPAAEPPSSDKAPAAEPPAADKPAAEPPSSDKAPGAEPPAVEPTAADKAPVDPATLVGQFGFDASTEARVKCKKVDAKTAKMLASKGYQCSHPPEDSSFAEGAGAWTRCAAGDDKEWVVYPTARICKDQLETMEANGD